MLDLNNNNKKKILQFFNDFQSIDRNKIQFYGEIYCNHRVYRCALQLPLQKKEKLCSSNDTKKKY